MNVRRCLPVLLGLMFASPAFASAVAGCRYEGEVVSIVEDVDGKKGELAIELKLSLSEGFGPGGSPGCAAVGETIRFEVDDDAGVRNEALKAGERVKVSWMTSSTPGLRDPHRQDFDGRIPAEAEPKPPTP